ncbi:MAG: VIT and VWA domain-containing protein [Desulfobacteraceae bacterium]|jgi:Ca-activated chloride channel family protein
MPVSTLTAIVLACSVLIPVGPALAQTPSKTLSPYLFIEGGDQAKDRFPLKHTSVEAVINGVIADVKVTQRYANMAEHPINARYVFPASVQAAVHGMQMTVGEDVVVAKIKERQAAEQEFNEAKASGQSASLLEQQRPNVFTMQVANIMPGETATIELHYSELLIPETGQYTFVYPTVVGPRYSAIPEATADDHHLWIENPYLSSGRKPTSEFTMNITLAAGLPLQQVACDTHATEVSWQSEARAHIKLAESETHGGNRDFILNYRLSGDQIHAGMMLYEGEDENFFTLMVQPPERVVPEAIPAREYIFVVDVSGSMHGFPLDTAKTLLKELIGSLRRADTFNVILFAGAAQVLAPKSLPADPANIKAALKHIDQEQGGGGTELYRAIKRGLALPRTSEQSRTMVVVTDGYIAAEKEVFGLIADNLNRSNLFAFGIGSSVNRYLIKGLAKAGLGEPFVVTDPRFADHAAKRFQNYIQAPLLTGIKIDFGDFDTYDVEPKVTADLFAQRPLVICGKWRGAPDGTVAMTGYTGGGAYEQKFSISPHLVSSGSTRALPFLWARTRLARLSDFSPHENDDEAMRAEVTRLGLDYNLLTRYTSFVAVHEKVRNTAAPAQEVDQPLAMPHGVSNLAVGGRNVPEPGLTVMVLMVSAATLLWTRRRRSACR